MTRYAPAVQALVDAGDLRAAAERLEGESPGDAAALYGRLLDHERAANCLAAAGRGAEAMEAALLAAIPEQVHRLHLALLAGEVPGVSAVEAVYTAHHRFDLASEAAQAMGRPLVAARHAEDDGDVVRAGTLWAAAERYGRAIEVLSEDPVAGAEAMARMRLRLGQPRAALQALSDTEPGPLHVLALLELGLVEAARKLEPGLERAAVARTRLAREVDAVPVSGHLGLVRVDAPEPDGEGAGFLGAFDGQPVSVRILPTDDALQGASAALASGLAGVPKLIEVDPAQRLVVVGRRGVTLDAWLSTGPTVEQVRTVLGRVADTLSRAHQNALYHGRLQANDIRVLPGGLTMTDGWHRRYLAASAETRAAHQDLFVAPEVLLGQPVTAAADVFSLARLVETVFDGVDVGTMTASKPSHRPSMDALSAMLERVRPTAYGAREASVVPTPMGQRYCPPPGAEVVRAEDTALGWTVELVPVPPGTDLSRLHALADPALETVQRVLAIHEGQIVLRALADEPGQIDGLDLAALRRDLDRLHGHQVALGLTADALRGGARTRVRVANLLFATEASVAKDRAFLEMALKARDSESG